MKARTSRRSAFSLIELVVVTIVLGLLLAVALPHFFGASRSATDSAAQQYLQFSYKAAKVDAGLYHSGAFGTPAEVAAAIVASEPELTAVTGNCPTDATSDQRHIIVDASTGGGNITLCNDPARQIWTLAAVNYSEPIITVSIAGAVAAVATPVSSSSPVLSGVAQVGVALAATNGTWLNTGGSTVYAYTWQSCDGSGANCANVGTGATSYTIGTGDLGRRLAVFVSATNPGGASSAPAISQLTTAVANTYSATVLADNPSIYYRFGEASGASALDVKGVNQSGYFGSFTLNQPGVFSDGNHAVSLGATGELWSGSQTGLPLGTAARTFELWVKNPNPGGVFLGYGAQTAGNAFGASYAAGNQISLWNWGTSPAPITLPANLANGAWHMLDITYASGSVSVYEDGAIVSGTPVAYTINTTVGTDGWVISRALNNSSSGYLGGSLDDFSVYPVALSVARIAAHYAAR